MDDAAEAKNVADVTRSYAAYLENPRRAEVALLVAIISMGEGALVARFHDGRIAVVERTRRDDDPFARILSAPRAPATAFESMPRAWRALSLLPGSDDGYCWGDRRRRIPAYLRRGSA